MAENPLARLARLLGGVVLTRGRLGHQVLGQLLIVDSSEIEVAGASVVVAASSGQRNAMLQATLRTAAPALAVHALAAKHEKRLVRLSEVVGGRERAVAARERALRQNEVKLGVERLELDRDVTRAATLEREKQALEGEVATLRHRLAVLDRAAASASPEPPPSPPSPPPGARREKGKKRAQKRG